jgi:hypothetical protein
LRFDITIELYLVIIDLSNSMLKMSWGGGNVQGNRDEKEYEYYTA